MEKRIFTLALVVVVGILLGVGVVMKQAREPLMKEMLKQQESLIKSQNRIEKYLGAGPDGAEGGNLDGSSAVKIFSKLQDLEQRLTSLEAQIKNGAQARVNTPPAPPAEDFTTVYDIPQDHTPIIGKKNAPVTIVEFLDFQCPFCARFHPPIEEILKAYPDQVNYMLKNFPLSFHPQARPAAKAAFAAAEQGKYHEMVMELLKNNTNLTDDTFKKIAGDLGLNVDKFMKDYQGKDAQWEKYIEADMELGGNVGVRGTPTYFINGRKTVARDFPSYKREIDAILSEKK